jgi:hypothetical protein
VVNVLLIVVVDCEELDCVLVEVIVVFGPGSGVVLL